MPPKTGKNKSSSTRKTRMTFSDGLTEMPAGRLKPIQFPSYFSSRCLNRTPAA